MADLYGLEASGLPPELVAQLSSVQGRRKIAESMLQRGMTPMQVQNGVASWTQGLAQLANAYMGRKGIEAADKEAQGISEKRKSLVSQAMADYEKRRMGVPDQTAPFQADTFPGEAPIQGLQTITQKGVAPDREGAYRAAMISGLPEMGRVAQTDFNLDAKNQAREDQQAFQKDQLKAQTEARAADRAAQIAAAKEKAEADRAARMQEIQMRLEDRALDRESRAAYQRELIGLRRDMVEGSKEKAPPGYRFKPDGGLEAIPGGPKDMTARNQAIADTAAMKSKQMIEDVDSAISKINFGSTGFIGGVTGKVPGTPGFNLDRALDTIKANIGFNELQAMRQASPTGGALGQVAVQELNMLQAVLGSLDKGQDEEQLVKNLKRIKTHYSNWKKAVDTAAAQEGGAAPTAAPAPPQPVRKKWNPATGKLE